MMFSSSDVYSWRKAREILMEVARRGEERGYGTPCLLVAAKDDLDPYPMSVQESDRVNASLKPNMI
jgi:Ras family protein T1